MELRGFEKAVKDELYKLASISLCSNVAGQVMVSHSRGRATPPPPLASRLLMVCAGGGVRCAQMELMVNPPKPGQPSFPKYEQERDTILSSLRRRAEKLVAALNKLEGVSCLPAQGGGRV